MEGEIVVGLYDSHLASAIVDYAKEHGLKARAVNDPREVDVQRVRLGVFDLGFGGKNLRDMSESLGIYRSLQERGKESEARFIGISKFPDIVERARQEGIPSYAHLLDARVQELIEEYSLNP